MNGLIGWLDRKLYPSFQRKWDDRLFRARIQSHLEHTPKDVLDLGAGAGITAEMDFRGRARRVCGVDPDPRVATNPYLDEGQVGFGEAIPYPDESFDLVFANNVFEHLSEPQKVFFEVRRVLRPLGVFLAKTPNKWHYMPLIARLTPQGFHQWFNRKRGGRAYEDTFPTPYLANTQPAIRKLASSTGFEVARIELIEGRPEYLRITLPTYLLGWVYERIVNALPGFERFRILLIAELRKPVGESS